MHNTVDQTIRQIEQVLRGKNLAIRLALASFFAGGHVLLEDLPGMGKTTLAAALARALGLDYKRVQFTSDMLPSDLLGATVFDQDSGSFHFHKGPVFTQLLLADEINRTTPKTQSALLEAMSEHHVSVDGQSIELPQPFFVIATQNPITQFGTFPLPESQLDRFLVRIELGYPDARSERALLQGTAGRQLLEQIQPTLAGERLLQIQQQVNSVHVSEALLDYIQALVAWTRDSSELQYGISPRGALALLKVSKAWAYMARRDFIIPEDVQAVLPSVFLHRLVHAANSASEAATAIELMLRDVPVS